MSRAVAVDASTRALVADMAAAGYGRRVIARSLDARGIPTPSGAPGARWWPDTVAAVLDDGADRRARQQRWRDRNRAGWSWTL
jgi:hypothetical protein